MHNKDIDNSNTPKTPSSSNKNTTIITEETKQSKQQSRSSEEFDYVEKEIDEELICSICLLPFIDPISHNSCGNTFCSKCVESVLNCPMCGEGEFKQNCAPSVKMIRNLLDKLKVKCGMCKNIVLRGELKDHQEKYCPLHEAYQQVEELKKKLEQEFQERVQKLENEHQETKSKLEQEFQSKLNKLEQALVQEFNEKQELLKIKIEECERSIVTREKLEMSNKPIHLNVGGTIMTVSLGTFIHNEIEPDNLFKKMFTGQHPCYQTPSTLFSGEVYFIDCDPIVFKHILEWLKYGIIAKEISNDLKQTLSAVCKEFGLKNISLQNCLHQTNPISSSIIQKCSNATSLFSSNCINDSSISCELYSHTESKSIPQLLYRGSRDGFKAEQFHSKCDNQGPTLTIIKSAEHNQIFGAFTSQSWQTSHGKFVSDSSAFIFKICKDSTNQNYQFKKFNIKQDKKQKAIYLNKDWLPTFGNGWDISIRSDCNLNNNSCSNFGSCYELPNGYKYGINEAKSYLAGSENFKVCEIEVFKINQ